MVSADTHVGEAYSEAQALFTLCVEYIQEYYAGRYAIGYGSRFLENDLQMAEA